jgi:hypothetical protein
MGDERTKQVSPGAGIAHGIPWDRVFAVPETVPAKPAGYGRCDFP